MLSIVFYSNWMMPFFAYSAISLTVLFILFTIMTLRIPYTTSEKIKEHLWENGSIFMRVCFFIQVKYVYDNEHQRTFLDFKMNCVWTAARLVTEI